MVLKSTIAAPSPWREIARIYFWVIVVSAVLLVLNWASTAHAGSPSRRTIRLGVVRPARLHARGLAGFPMRQAAKNFTGAVYHTAKSVDNVTANLRIGRIIGDIILTPFRR